MVDLQIWWARMLDLEILSYLGRGRLGPVTFLLCLLLPRGIKYRKSCKSPTGHQRVSRKCACFQVSFVSIQRGPDSSTTAAWISGLCTHRSRLSKLQLLCRLPPSLVIPLADHPRVDITNNALPLDADNERTSALLFGRYAVSYKSCEHPCYGQAAIPLNNQPPYQGHRSLKGEKRICTIYFPSNSPSLCSSSSWPPSPH